MSALEQNERFAVPKDKSVRLGTPRGRMGGGELLSFVTSIPDPKASNHYFSEPNVGDSADDPDAPNFVHNQSIFRGPLQSRETLPRATRRKWRNSWLGINGSASDGFFRRWIEEPLGHAEDEDTRPSSTSQVPYGLNKSNDLDRESPREEPTRQPPPYPFASTSISQTQDPCFPTSEQELPNHEADQNDEEPIRSEAPITGNASPVSRLASRRWAIIRRRLVPTHAVSQDAVPGSAVTPDVNISDELLGGGLAALMLKMHFDRDEQNQRRVPVLLHHLKIRVSDSVHPMKGIHATFRIEVCDTQITIIRHL